VKNNLPALSFVKALDEYQEILFGLLSQVSIAFFIAGSTLLAIRLERAFDDKFNDR